MGVVVAISVAKIFAIAMGILYIKELETEYRLLLLQILLALLTEIGGRYISTVYHISNLWMFNIYAIIEFWLLAMVARYFIGSSIVKKAIIYIAIAITFIWIAEIYQQGANKWATKTIVLQSIVLICLYFKALFDQVLFNRTTPYKQPIFWISLSVILFFGCILPFMALYNVFNTHYAELSSIFTNYLINVVNFLRYPMVGIAFYLHYKEKIGIDKIRRGYA